MPKKVYVQFKTQCLEILRDLYEIVESPIDGPGKTDFGDVDIAVQGPKEGTITTDAPQALEQISEALGAVRMIVAKGEDASSNLAVPWPELLESRTINEDAQQQESPEGTAGAPRPQSKEPKYIQVDISIFTDRDRLEWATFKHAHGDVWNLIGTTIRPYGLTVDHHAMWLRIPEVEKSDRKRGRVFLSADHIEILDFLGLPVSTYFQGQFPDLNAMYEYVAQCRMFYVPPQDQDDELHDQEGGAPTQPNDQARRSLKANDRKRMGLRPAFRKWIDEFQPECRRLGRFSEQRTTREEIKAESIARFHVGEEYDRRLHEFLDEKQRLYIANTVIKGAIPLPADSTQRQITYRACLVKALKSIILEGDLRYGVNPPEDCKDQNGLFNVNKVLVFIEKHKDEIGKIASDNQMESYKAKKAIRKK